MYCLLKSIKFSVKKIKILKKNTGKLEKNTGKVREFYQSGKVGTLLWWNKCIFLPKSQEILSLSQCCHPEFFFIPNTHFPPFPPNSQEYYFLIVEGLLGEYNTNETQITVPFQIWIASMRVFCVRMMKKRLLSNRN